MATYQDNDALPPSGQGYKPGDRVECPAGSAISAWLCVAPGVWVPESLQLLAGGRIPLPGESGAGFALGAAQGFGWYDITAEIDVRGSGANDPTFSAYTGRPTFFAMLFSATAMNQAWVNFHIPHDYVAGSPVHFHTHWSNAAATPNTGVVRWGFEYMYAKGHNQEPFSAQQIVYAEQASPAVRYQHMVTESAGVTIPGMEPDGIVAVRVFRDAANVADTCTDPVFLHTADLHYQSTGLPTKNKSPSFYGE